MNHTPLCGCVVLYNVIPEPHSESPATTPFPPTTHHTTWNDNAGPTLISHMQRIPHKIRNPCTTQPATVGCGDSKYVDPGIVFQPNTPWGVLTSEKYPSEFAMDDLIWKFFENQLLISTRLEGVQSPAPPPPKLRLQVKGRVSWEIQMPGCQMRMYRTHEERVQSPARRDSARWTHSAGVVPGVAEAQVLITRPRHQPGIAYPLVVVTSVFGVAALVDPPQVTCSECWVVDT
ncbi:hypothetical protein BS47DRAFT_1361733 [Hydnum rufescens UP504]|uniref:Uncharacterized protein n=1 Tax=Hydnum rufescens UP504 TaxID=1448309 RepID=A0A9P6AYW4_9AGAM|nr:hypothetical protein BS47DRAFT_1361733 [Hydnum rufescens UP504]